MLATFSGLNPKGPYLSLETEKDYCVVFTYSIKRAREIWKFHIAVVQQRLRNVQNSVMHVQSCCCCCFVFFCQSEPIVFLLFAVAIAKLPNVVIQKFCYHGIVTSLLLSIKESIKTKRKAEIVSISVLSKVLKLMLHGTIRSVLTVRNNVAMLCCAKSRHLKLYINCHNHEFGI